MLFPVPGQTTWTRSSAGIDVTVRIDTASPRVGRPVQFDIELSSPGPCCGLIFRSGEELRFEDFASCPSGEPTGPGTVRFRRTHTYSSSGRFEFTVGGAAGCTAAGMTSAFSSFIDVA